MKRFQLLSALALVVLILSTSCSDDVSNKIDANLLESLTRGSASTCYEFKSVEVSDKRDTPDSEWKPIDLYDWYGWSLPTPTKIVIYDGKSWSPLELTSYVQGRHPLYFPLVAYAKKTGSWVTFYVARKFEYNQETNMMKVGDDEYEVKRIDEDRLTLVALTKYTDNDGEGWWKWVCEYEKAPLNEAELELSPFYDSPLEAKLGIIKLLKSEFGDVFDINEYLSPDISFPDPMIDLNEMEEYILAGNDYEYLRKHNI